MSTKLIVTNYKNFKCGVKLNEGELVNIRFQPNEDVQIGDIYKVKITEILPNDSGAFVSYGNGDQRGFFKRINFPNGDKAHEGQSLLLQVRSIGSKDKVHLFTNNVILTGKFINLLPYGDEIILSRRTRKNLDTNQKDKIDFLIQGSGNETRSFINIKDFTDGLMLVLEKGEKNNIYHIGTEEEITIKKLAEYVADFFNVKINIIPGKIQKGGTDRRCPDISKLKDLGFKQKVGLSEGISKMSEWYIKNKSLKN